MSVLGQETDIIVITETWLNSSVYNAQLFDERYEVHRRDRHTGQTRGGGLLVALRRNSDGPRAERLQHLETDGENMWLKINLNGLKIYTCIVYIPPASPIERYTSLFENIISNHKLLNNKKILLIGDFNFYSCLNFKNTTSEFSYVLDLFQMSNKNFVLNSKGRSLDLIVSNFDLNVCKSISSLVSEDPYHPSLDVEFQYIKKNVKMNQLMIIINS